MRSTASIRNAKSTASSLPAGPQRGTGDTSKTISGPGTDSRNDSNAANTNPNPEEDRLRKRGSLGLASPRHRMEAKPCPLPLTINKSELSSTSVDTPRSPLSSLKDSAASQKLQEKECYTEAGQRPRRNRQGSTALLVPSHITADCVSNYLTI